MYESFSRDEYDLHYHRYLPSRFVTPRGTVQEQPNDPDFDAITDLENALNGLIKKRNILLNQHSEDLKLILDEAVFFFERLKILNPTATLGINPDAFQRKGCGHRRDAFNELTVLQKRTTDAIHHRDTLQQIFKASIDAKVQSFQEVNGRNEDVLLYRIKTTPSIRTPLAGNSSATSSTYRSSGWNRFVDITNDAISIHLTGTGRSTPMISLEESPARLMALVKKVSHSNEGESMIEVFSLRMLQHIGVLLARSTDLCRDRLIPTTDLEKKGRTHGVSDTHWLVMHWIPEEAMVAKLGVFEFLAVAREGGVIDNITSQTVLDTQCSVRFGIQDFREDSLVNPKPSLQKYSSPTQLPIASTAQQLSPPSTVGESINTPVVPTTLLQPTEQAKPQDTSTQTSLDHLTEEPDTISETSGDLIHTPGSWIDTPPPELSDVPRPITPAHCPPPSGSEPEQSKSSDFPQRAKSVIPHLADLIPSVFGTPTPLASRHRNIKSPFTAAIDSPPKGFFATEAKPFGSQIPQSSTSNKGSVLKPSKGTAWARPPSVFQAIGAKSSQ